jgi:competence protein ComGD
MVKLMSHLNQLGYSLLETLIVLAIFLMLISLTVPATYSLLEKKNEEKVLELFQYDIFFLQNQSIANGREDYLRMVIHKNGYAIANLQKDLIVRELPRGWEIDPRNLNHISFNHNGSTRFSGTLEIKSPKNRYIVTFPIGKGRGYIEKQ